MKYLSANTSAKTAKTAKETDYLQAILYLIPDLQLCPMSEAAGCANACLVTSGRGAFTNVREARQRKTDAFKADPAAFVDQLKLDIVKLKRKCEKLGKKPLIRLNGTSDVDFQAIKGSDGVSVYDAFPECQFIEYSKMPGRKAPPNVHITLSYSEANKKYAAKVARSDRNIAVVFRYALPKTFLGRPVIDGDKHDARNLDPKGVVVGLLAKGKDGKNDHTGFVIDHSILAKSA